LAVRHVGVKKMIMTICKEWINSGLTSCGESRQQQLLSLQRKQILFTDYEATAGRKADTKISYRNREKQPLS
jgi:hypothetical protein